MCNGSSWSESLAGKFAFDYCKRSSPQAEYNWGHITKPASSYCSESSSPFISLLLLSSPEHLRLKQKPEETKVPTQSRRLSASYDSHRSKCPRRSSFICQQKLSDHQPDSRILQPDSYNSWKMKTRGRAKPNSQTGNWTRPEPLDVFENSTIKSVISPLFGRKESESTAGPQHEHEAEALNHGGCSLGQQRGH